MTDDNNNGNNNDDNDNGRGIISTSQDFHQKSLRGFGLKILKTILFLILANFFLFFLVENFEYIHEDLNTFRASRGSRTFPYIYVQLSIRDFLIQIPAIIKVYVIASLRCGRRRREAHLAECFVTFSRRIVFFFLSLPVIYWPYANHDKRVLA